MREYRRGIIQSDVIKTADHIIDPPDGATGGKTLHGDCVALCPDSYTGDYLKRILRKEGGS